MLAQMKKVERKKPGPKATGKGEQVVVRIQPDLMAALEEHQTAIGSETRAATIRQVLTDFFKRKGIL